MASPTKKKARKPAEPAAPLTYEQRCAHAWVNTSTRFAADEKDLIPRVPEARRLQPGDALDIGMLQDCVVVNTSDDGRFVLVDFTRVDNNYGNPIRKEHELAVWAWVDCIKLSDIGQSAFARTQSLHPAYLNSDVRSLLSTVLRRGTIDSPDYQRDYVWTLPDKEALIDSVFNERALGSFLFVEFPFEAYRGRLEVLDGKQRLNALVGFYTSQFPYRGTYYHELSRRDRDRFESAPVQFAHLDGRRTSRAERLQIFLDVNHGGVPQTAAHLLKVQQMLDDELAKGAE